MYAKDAIDINIVPLKPNQIIAEAIDWCTEYHSKYAYIVEEAKMIGRFSEDFLFNYDDQKLLNTLLEFAEPIIILENQHCLELISKAKLYNSFVLPIVDNEKNFLGLTSAESILNTLFDKNILNEQQSIFIVEIIANNYAMSDVAKIVESNNAHIIYSNYNRYNSNAQITLILQGENFAAIANTFERFGYEVMYQSAENVYTDHLIERAESFIKFLEV